MITSQSKPNFLNSSTRGFGFSAMLLVVFFSSLCISNITAQDLFGSPTKERILIGEPFDFVLTAEMPLNSVFSWPNPKEDTLNEFDIVSRTNIDTLAKKATWELTQTWTLTSFDSGYFVIPPQVLVWGDDTLFTDPVLIQVGMPDALDDVPFYEIKDIEKAPINWLPIIWWSIAIMGFGLVAYLLWRYFNRKPKPAPKVTPKPVIPAEVLALAELEKLRKKALWKQQLFKEHYDLLTTIFRDYIHKRHNLPALELTSDELLADIKARGLEAGFGDAIKRLLQASDMAKFAKGKTDMQTAESLLSVVENYVKATTPTTEKKIDNE